MIKEKMKNQSNGKFFVQMSSEIKALSTEDKLKLLFDIERFLNSEVSTQLYSKFDIGIRFHITGIE